ncbi:iron transporter [halophilic archaeon]|nr:iron transporter [halophilic archaeon]
MQRREFLQTGAVVAGSVTTTGCLKTLGFQKQSAWRDPPMVDDRPDGVYYPAYIEGMGMYGMAKDGEYRVALMYSYPHRFWNLTGQTKNKIVVQPDDSLHLMVSLWDAKTQTVLPADIQLTIMKDGSTVTNRTLWPMLSQNMGFHYGDNMSLDGEGSYTATIETPPLGVRQAGEFESRLSETASVEINFEFDTSQVYKLEYKELPEKGGTRGAINPTMRKVPVGRAPDPKALPGRLLGVQSSDDAKIAVTMINGPNQFIDKKQSYIAVSPRTPYNQIVLPRMAMSLELLRNGSVVSKTPLTYALDSELDNHYGGAVKKVQADDTLRLTVGSPPQLARHDGYETAFMQISPIEFTV